jgi:hypothetical protein
VGRDTGTPVDEKHFEVRFGLTAESGRTKKDIREVKHKMLEKD